MALVFLATGSVYKVVFPDQSQMGDIILATGAMFVAVPVFVNGFSGLFSKDNKFMTEQLVSLAILASMVEGDFVVAIIIPVILVFGHLLEEKSIMGIEEAISSLKKLHSRHARVIRDKEEILIEPEDVKVDEVVVCYPGETIPADGVIFEGESLINQAPITGESVPIEAYSGVAVFAGTVNLSGKIKIKVSCNSTDTLFNKIVNLLSEAEKSKAPIIKIIEKYLTLYFPFVIMVAAITLFATSDISRAITILVISCPCALILASPTAMISSLVACSRRGIMIKNSAFLESVAEVDTLILDKTGTVTYGKLELEQIKPMESVDSSELLNKAAICASGSIHPVSVAIRTYAREKQFSAEFPASQKEFHGKGVRATFNDKTILLGKLSWILENTKIKEPDKNMVSGTTSVWVAEGDRLLGEIHFSDKPRDEIKDTISLCKEKGIKNVYLLTGDKKEIGERVGTFLGVDETIAECLPQTKLDFVNQKKAEDHKVMFVGDGINDSLALKASDVGVAIAKGGSDIAIQNADIALGNENLSNLPEMFRLSEDTRAIINQNIVIGTTFSFLMIGIASAGYISPIMGAISHNIGSLFVVLNSARMLKETKEEQKEEEEEEN